MKRIGSLLVPLLVSSVLGAQQPAPVLPAAVRAAADTISAPGLKQDLDFLSSDELLGRNTPSPGFDKAAAYIVERLKKAGLRPAGDDGSFLQHYEVRESRVATDRAVVGIGDATFKFGNDFVLRSFAAPLSGSFEAVYVGHGWTVPGKGIDPFAGIDVKGKLVVAHAYEAMPRDAGVSRIGRIAVGGDPVFAEAARRGAAGVVFLTTAGGREAMDNLARQNTARREMEPSVPSAYAAPPVTSLVLSPAARDALFAGERIPGAELLRRGDAGDFPASFTLGKQVRVTIPVSETATHRPYNVVAMVEGSDPGLKDECVTVASHLDGAVGTRAVAGDAIYNAADDNASGSAGNLQIAERIAAVKPRRCLIFIWDSGEERGLWGTRRFVSRPPVPLERIVAHFNIDMIGASRRPGSADANTMTVTAPNEVFLVGPRILSPRAELLLDAINAAYLNVAFNRVHDRADGEFFYPRTDAGPFLERGILTIDLFTGIHPRYHLPSDEARYLDPAQMEAITRTAFAAIWAFADATERPRIENPLPPSVPRYK
jgi:hypothetical protein